MAPYFTLAAALAAISITIGAAYAAPYATRYTGAIADSTIPGIRNGESYEVTLILNNEQATAASQTWDQASLVCTIWRFNTDRSARFQVSLRTFPPGSYNGSMTTTADGAVSGMFSSIVSNGLDALQYNTTANLVLPPAVTWRIGSAQNALYAGGGTANTTSFRDSLYGSPRTQPGDWSAPQRVRGNTFPCDDSPEIPGIPRQVAAMPGDGRIDVTWQPPALEPGDTVPETYEVIALPDSGPSSTCTVTHPNTGCALSGLTNGMSYRVGVLSIAKNLRSPLSPNVSATPFAPGAPGAPTNVVATPGDAQVTLSWQPPTNGGAPTSYRVAFDAGNPGCVAQAPATTCTVRGLSNGSSYTFIVYAVNAVGETASLRTSGVTPMAGLPGAGGIASVPTLSAYALVLLALSAAGLGMVPLRARATPREDV